MKNKPLLMIAILLSALLVSTGVAAQEDSTPPSNIGLELVAEGLTSPVDLAQPNDDSGRLFVVDQVGIIYVIDADGELLDALSLTSATRSLIRWNSLMSAVYWEWHSTLNSPTMDVFYSRSHFKNSC
ncbi:MAG: hypothetical protein ACOCX5_01455 [Chloroflexota bacterium]